MVTTLSQLVEMIERGTIPAWLRDEITAKKDDIANALREGGMVTLNGPNGQEVRIRAERQVAAA
jgi:23S rRNA A2030 N6-methylase RlmJ